MSCPTSERLLDHALDLLVERERRRFAEHLERCAACRARAEALDEEQALLEWSLSQEPGPEASGLEARVLAEVRARRLGAGLSETGGQARGARRRRWLAAAAVLLAGAGLGLYAWPEDRERVLRESIRWSERRALGLGEDR